MPRKKKPATEQPPKPGERIAHPELVTRCKEPGKGWRRDHFGDWWPCQEQDAGEEHDCAAD